MRSQQIKNLFTNKEERCSTVSAMVNIIGNGIGKQNSDLRQGCLCFVLMPLRDMNPSDLLPVTGK